MKELIERLELEEGLPALAKAKLNDALKAVIKSHERDVYAYMKDNKFLDRAGIDEVEEMASEMAYSAVDNEVSALLKMAKMSERKFVSSLKSSMIKYAKGKMRL